MTRREILYNNGSVTRSKVGGGGGGVFDKTRAKGVYETYRSQKGVHELVHLVRRHEITTL
jgi:hypothetical protein